MDFNSKKIMPTKQDLKKKPEKRLLIKCGIMLDKECPFNKLKKEKKKNIEKIFIKKKSY